VRCIPLNEAQVEMILAADALNAEQMLLLKKGTCLSAENLRMLKSWGIGRLCVESPADEKNENVKTPETIIDLEQEILSRFTSSVESTMVAEVCRVAAKIIHERDPLKE